VLLRGALAVVRVVMDDGTATLEAGSALAVLRRPRRVLFPGALRRLRRALPVLLSGSLSVLLWALTGVSDGPLTGILRPCGRRVSTLRVGTETWRARARLAVVGHVGIRTNGV
jgi:hypothetical protein